MFKNRFMLIMCVFVLIMVLPMPVLAAGNPSPARQITPPVQTLASGDNFTCWVRDDGTLLCWGENDSGQTTPPSGTFTQVSAGDYDSCGLRTDGTVDCWTSDVSAPSGTFTQITARWGTYCGVQSDGTVACWGNNSHGQATPPSGTFLQVSAGYQYTCGIQSDNTVVCWGDNTNGVSTPPSGSFVQISAEDYHACGLKTDGTVACWGQSDGTPPTGTFTQVSAGVFDACGVRSDASIVCWDSYKQWSIAGAFTQVSMGSSVYCALTSDNMPVCWGSNDEGQLTPISISGHSAVPFTTLNYVDGTAKSVDSDSNGDYSLGVSYNWSGTVTPSDDAGDIFLPGSRSYANLTTNQTNQDYGHGVKISGYVDASGTVLSYEDGGPKTVTADSQGAYSMIVPYGWSGTLTPSLSGFQFKPVNRTYTNLTSSRLYETYRATSGTVFPEVSSGDKHSCLLNKDGKLNCWGNDDVGEASPPAGTFTQVSAGEAFTCALRTTGALVCWGANFYGQAKPPAGAFTQVSAGEFHTCALRTNGTAVCWGDNEFHQVSPVPSGTFTQISAGTLDTCGLRSTGAIVCWGSSPVTGYKPAGTFASLDINNDACAIKLNGTIACWDSLASPGGAFTQASVGDGFACGLRTNGTVACWGFNANRVKPPTGVFFQLSSGSKHVCGLKVNNVVVCWGSNHYAQLEPSKLSFVSNGAYDGSIVESSETSGKGGTADASSNVLVLGDDTSNRQSRAMLSFETKFLPDTAVIKTVVLNMMQAGAIKGSNPFSVLGSLLIDIRKGPFGGGVLALQPPDFDAPASAVKVGVVNKTSTANLYTDTLNAAGMNQINKLGPTQLRLYFTKDDNNDHIANSINFYSGNGWSNSMGSEVEPILIVGYTMP